MLQNLRRRPGCRSNAEQSTQAGAEISTELPVHYIRPIGSKCFAGELLHFRGSVFDAGDLRVPLLPRPHSRLKPRCARPTYYSIFQTTEREEFPSPGTRPSLTTDPLSLTQKKEKWSVGKRRGRILVPTTIHFWCYTLMIRPVLFGRSVRGEVAERLNAAVC